MIRDVPAGEHTLIASYVAYITDTIEGVKVRANEETTIQSRCFQMTSI